MSQRKKARQFSPEYKLRIVERMLAGENVSALAREIKVLRKTLYEWKDAYVCYGPKALRTRGRPRKEDVLIKWPEATTKRAELLQARKRIAELERKVGHQEMEIDFFVGALQRLNAIRQEEENKKKPRSTVSSESKRGKAD